ncbi:acyl-CoA dehydrogenase [Natrinema salsiterrestre]|uniref:Acyl-CoA dehydrogenase n=1 Tax=Natrinema salsiterrestre TaxID=2950540 RepID=A0A9Q4Q1F6_9EURY|nr:acyl-CoA dehydrogenase [Natrinema salsiterrestre]MDF9747960.1 acyl-CoA dehydrogenase [Natrinema salsiterrestre]
MKDGSGNLDFGDSDSSEEESTKSEPPVGTPDDSQPDRGRSRSSSTRSEPISDQPGTSSTSTNESEQDEHKYPYFVRRSKVLDERDERIEAHLREVVTDQESDFRSELADELETNGDISKSDAREFALLYAFENPEGVAELMREEGFGELE